MDTPGINTTDESLQHISIARRPLQRLPLAVTVLADMLTVLVSVFFTFALVDWSSGASPLSLNGTGLNSGLVAAALVLLWGAWLLGSRLYDMDALSSGSIALQGVVRASAFATVSLVVISFLVGIDGSTRSFVLTLWLLSTAGLAIERMTIRRSIAALRSHGKLIRRTLVVGTTLEVREIIDSFGSESADGMDLVAFLTSTAQECAELQSDDFSVPCWGAARILPQVVRMRNIDVVIIAATAFSHPVIPRMIGELRGVPLDIYISAGLSDVATRRVRVREVGGMPLVTVKSVSLSASSMAIKRTLDVVVSSVVLLIGLPVWLSLIALIILGSKGPVFFKQERVGQRGKTFFIYKFRTMIAGAEDMRCSLEEHNEADGPIFKMRDDPRITPIGRFMRRFSLDEFPQLINVLKGEMSLVGPRPPLPCEVEEYSDYHWRRMEVSPGMTGLWQVSGRSNLSFDEMVRLDLFYIGNWSVFFDLKVLVLTFRAVVAANGAY